MLTNKIEASLYPRRYSNYMHGIRKLAPCRKQHLPDTPISRARPPEPIKMHNEPVADKIGDTLATGLERAPWCGLPCRRSNGTKQSEGVVWSHRHHKNHTSCSLPILFFEKIWLHPSAVLTAQPVTTKPPTALEIPFYWNLGETQYGSSDICVTILSTTPWVVECPSHLEPEASRREC